MKCVVIESDYAKDTHRFFLEILMKKIASKAIHGMMQNILICILAS